jgi:hypothetical protein
VNRLVGRGWATVELDRAAEELASGLEPGATFVDAPRSVLLGARCRVGRARSREHGPRWIVLLEPDTEGRLAAFLARSGEGWAAAWEADEAGGRLELGGGASGPLGEERLVDPTFPAGPFRLRSAAATIER